jgi:hypothetical protein
MDAVDASTAAVEVIDATMVISGYDVGLRRRKHGVWVNYSMSSKMLEKMLHFWSLRPAERPSALVEISSW